MMMPPWLPLRPDLPGRDAPLAALAARLETAREARLSGPPGIGKTAVAGALVARAGRDAVAASFAGCEDESDALRALGEALGAAPVGDESAVLDAARSRGPLLLVADDVAFAAVLDVIRRVAGSVPGTALLVVSEQPLDDDTWALGPLEPDVLSEVAPGAAGGGRGLADTEGNPLLARLVRALDLPLEEALARLQARADALAAFPMGLPGAPGPELPAVALRPDRSDRTVLRRGIAARLHAVAPARAAAAGLERVASLLRLADGGHLSDVPDTRDLLLLRQIARTTTDTGARSRCIAAASRLAAAAGQFDVARTLLTEASGGTPLEHACLLWADADALLGTGEIEASLARFAEASESYRRGRAPLANATMLRRAADRLAARGQIVAAERLYRQARWFYRSAANPLGIAATVRGAADLAVASGEWVSAGTLHEQVEAALGPDAPLERANLRLSELSLAISRGDYARGEQLLRALGTLAASEVLVRANTQRRRADLLLRRGDHEGAAVAAERAAGLYASVGEAAAQAACARLGGDIHAAAGRLREARAAYAGALRLQVRIQDLRGLMRTLEHAAVVEEALGRPAAGRRRREQRAAVVAALGEG